MSEASNILSEESSDTIIEIIDETHQPPSPTMEQLSNEAKESFRTAVERGNVDNALTMLESHKINVNDMIVNEGYTALMLAAKLGHTTLVKELLKVPDININFQSKETLQTALILAVAESRFDTVNALLVIDGIDVNLKNKNGEDVFSFGGFTTTNLPIKWDYSLESNWGNHLDVLHRITHMHPILFVELVESPSTNIFNAIMTDVSKTPHQLSVTNATKILYMLLILWSYSSKQSEETVENSKLFDVKKNIEIQIQSFLNLNCFITKIKVAKTLLKNSDYTLKDIFDEDKSLLGCCLKNEIYVLFDFPNLSGLIDDIFLFCPTTVSNKISYVHSMRYCPLAMAILNAISDILLLINVCLVINSYQSKLDISWNQLEIVFTVFIALIFLGEVGKAMQHPTIWTYLGSMWSWVHVTISIMGLCWLCSRIHPTSLTVARIILSSMSIPITVGILKYLTILHHFCEKIIKMKAMIARLLSTSIIYLIPSTGVCITFIGIYYPYDQKYGLMELTVFMITLGQFPLNDNHHNPVIVIVGILLAALVYIMTNFMLFNVNSDQAAISEDKLFQQCVYTKAIFVKEFMIQSDVNIFAILPAPFNAIILLALPIQILWTKYCGIYGRQAGVSIVHSMGNIFIILILELPINIVLTCIAPRHQFKTSDSISNNSMQTREDYSYNYLLVTWYGILNCFNNKRSNAKIEPETQHETQQDRLVSSNNIKPSNKYEKSLYLSLDETNDDGQMALPSVANKVKKILIDRDNLKIPTCNGK